MQALARELIQDNILRGLIYPSQDAVDSAGFDDRLWDEEDGHTPAPELKVEDVPGGTITYVFERFSTNS